MLALKRKLVNNFREAIIRLLIKQGLQKANHWKQSFQKQPSRAVLRKRCSENMQQIYKRTRTPLDGYFCHLFCSAKQMTVFFKKWACYVHSHLSLLKVNIKNQNNSKNVFIFIQCGKISQISSRICLWEWFNRVGIFILRDALRDLVWFVLFEKGEKHPWRSVIFSKVAAWSLQFY